MARPVIAIFSIVVAAASEHACVLVMFVILAVPRRASVRRKVIIIRLGVVILEKQSHRLECAMVKR